MFDGRDDQITEKAKSSLLKSLGLADLPVNVNDDQIMSNVRHAVARQLPQIWPAPPSDEPVAIVGGGWSLKETWDELRDLYWAGTKIVALNGAARYLVDRNIKPSAVVILDSRPHNARFVFPIPGCKYFIAGQCDPTIFDAAIAAGETFIWHAVGAGETEKAFLDRYYRKNWHGVPWSCCVALRAVGLMRMRGCQNIHLFGVDSCYRDDGSHHAYDQPENDKEHTSILSVAGRRFRVSAWQVVQAVQFVDMAREIAERKISLNIALHGNGLLSHIIEHGVQSLSQQE